MNPLAERQLDQAVRIAVYDQFVATGSAPVLARLAERLGVRDEELAESYRRLAAQRALVLDAADDIAMAIPFAARPTAVRVNGPGIAWWANCAFDGLGIPAMLGCDADVETACPQSGTSIVIRVRNGAPQNAVCTLHLAVPLARWWDDIGHT
jgi:hypothetical protein